MKKLKSLHIATLILSSLAEGYGVERYNKNKKKK
jgi:hypothetical protein